MDKFTDIYTFWFEDLQPAQWYKKDPDLDRLILDRFSNVHQQAAQGKLAHWREAPQGRLAEIIILDQFSRNMFRDSRDAFAFDDMARSLTYEAVESGADKKLSASEKSFLYMPLMHSENLADHEKAMVLFAQPGLEGNLEFEIKHKVIIERFGRYPHRNEILERESTAEEKEFLQQPGSSF